MRKFWTLPLRNYGCDCSDAYPASDFLADNGLYLPSGSALEERDIQRVCGEIAAFACPGA
ncbi:MAG: hypothetical protein LBR82_05740 [Desulfovibrio sp.]|nr:hypothetical protein [Desulfovibrio sp.]